MHGGTNSTAQAAPAAPTNGTSNLPVRRRISREDVMTASDVADMLSIPASTVYRLARRGDLPCARLGRTVRFLRDDIEATLRSN